LFNESWNKKQIISIPKLINAGYFNVLLKIIKIRQTSHEIKKGDLKKAHKTSLTLSLLILLGIAINTKYSIIREKTNNHTPISLACIPTASTLYVLRITWPLRIIFIPKLLINGKQYEPMM